MRILKAMISVWLALLVTACATMSRDECLNADWELIGFEDGANGLSVTRIGQYREDCASHGVTPDRIAYEHGYREGLLTWCTYQRGLNAGKTGLPVAGVCPDDTDYHAGYDEGLLSYCTWDMGYEEGIDGRDYARVCPADVEPAFLEGFDLGHRIHSLRTRYDRLESAIADAVEEQRRNGNEIDALRDKVAYEDSLTGAQRRETMQEIEDLEDRQQILAANVLKWGIEIVQVRVELARLGASVSD